MSEPSACVVCGGSLPGGEAKICPTCDWLNFGAAIVTKQASEIERLRAALQLHAGDTMSLSNELDEWRDRALAAEEALSGELYRRVELTDKLSAFEPIKVGK